MKYRKTELGRQTFKEQNSTLSARQRSAFILIDGTKDDSFILKALAPTGIEPNDIQHLVAAGLIEPCDTAKPTGAVAPKESASNTNQATDEAPATPAPVFSEQEIYQRAYPVATKLTSGLGLFGMPLNLAVESASGYKDLLALAPRIQKAVGNEKFAVLERALKGL